MERQRKNEQTMNTTQSPNDPLQGLMIARRGKVVYEAFQGIQPTRPHVWASVTKTVNGLMTAIIEADDLLDMSKPASVDVAELEGTAWDKVSVLDDSKVLKDVYPGQPIRNAVLDQRGRICRLAERGIILRKIYKNTIN